MVHQLESSMAIVKEAAVCAQPQGAANFLAS